jgi:flavorubredoxin
MKPRKIRDHVSLLGAVDWDRRIFDSLIPIPNGTTYNCYLVRGSEKTALIDTVDPSKKAVLFRQLESVPRIDYLVANHAEPDHAGSIPDVLAKYPLAKLVTSPKGKDLIAASFRVAEDRFITVEDGRTISLGDKTLSFLALPWVHWPETMGTYIPEDKILFSGDFFGSHFASNEVFARDAGRVYLAAKRYYAEIMMPFRGPIARHLAKLEKYPLEIIAPSHGPAYDDPPFIVNAYRDWVLGPPKNCAVVLTISMHGTTRAMVDHLVAELTDLQVALHQFDLTTPEIGEIAMALVDAGTVVFGTPTVLAGPHPNAVYAAYLTNLLKPKLRFAAIVGAMGWGGKTVERLTELLSSVKPEFLDPVLVQGAPGPGDFEKIAALAETIAQKHRENNFA